MTRPLLIFIVVLAATRALAQPDQIGFISASSSNLTVSNYYFAKPNEMTIVVSVMGHVQRPGRYEIAKSIDLINLLALAGGATSDGTLSDVTVTRFMELKGGQLRRTELQLDLDGLAHTPSVDLVVSPGDVISVGRSTWATFRDVFLVTASAAVIVTAVSQVILVTQR
jgi:protein involved in polysaccharide export with SLBB domain